MKKNLSFASMSILMLAIGSISSCSESKVVPNDSAGETTSMTRSALDQQTIVLTYTDCLKTGLAPLKAGESYVWSSDNLNVITVDQKGMATGIATGTANIHVKRLNYGKVEQESETFAVTVTDIVPISDSRFKAYLVGNTNINKNGNNEIEASEAAAFNEEIDVKNDALINSLEGLRFFINLKRLNCSNTPIRVLDLYANTQLESLDCSYCKNLEGSMDGSLIKKELDLTYNERLTAFTCIGTDKLKEISLLEKRYEELTTNWILDKDDKLVLVVKIIVSG